MNKNAKAIGAVVLIVGFEFLFGPGLLYLIKIGGGELYSLSTSSSHPANILLQWAIQSIYAAILVITFWKLRKQTFLQDMYLTLQNKRQKKFALVLFIILIVLFIAALKKTGDFLSAVLNLIFYLFVVAFTEEFIFRGVCPFLLKNSSKAMVYLLPNLLFAGLHIFSYNNFQALSMETAIPFFCNQIIGLVVAGIIFQFIKEYTGTLWVPILLHAILDFSAISIS